MNYKSMTKKQLLEEITALTKRINKMESSRSHIIKLEDELRRSEKKYRELVNLLPQSVFETDTEGNITFSNLIGFKTFGYDIEDLYKGVTAFQMVMPEERAILKNNMQKVLHGEDIGSTEYTGQRKDGTTFPIIVFSSPIIEKQKPIGIRGIIIELSKLKQTEEELRKSEYKYRLLVENASEIILIAQDGFLKFVNPKAVEITQYSEEELKLRPFADFIHPDDRKTVYANYSKRIRGEKVPNDYSFRVINRSGKTIWVRLNAILTTWENRPATLNFLIDITEQKITENELIEREKQLFQAQKMEAIGRLTSGIAHDFNNMLTVIIGYSDYLLTSYKSDKRLISCIKNLKEAGERAASLTHQLLAFSRKQILKPKIINLNTIISNMNNMLIRLIGEDIELIVNLDPSLGNAKLDGHQIEQVIMNISVNARDAMPKGGKIMIETKNVYLDEKFSRIYPFVPPGDYIMLLISDNGIGMDKETQEHIFEPFYTTKENGKGTGLGLSTVYGIIKQSGGFVLVNSEPGKGTTFKIYFPRIKQNVEIEESPERKYKGLNGSETILLVEDDDIVRNMIFSVLNTYGYKVLDAKNSEAAINIVTKNAHQKIDLMITDVVMPGMSGKDLFEILNSKIPSLKKLYISGYTDNTIVHHGVLDRGIHFLQKPFTVDDLCTKIRELIDS